MRVAAMVAVRSFAALASRRFIALTAVVLCVVLLTSLVVLVPQPNDGTNHDQSTQTTCHTTNNRWSCSNV